MLEHLSRVLEIAGPIAALQAAIERLGGPRRLVAVKPREVRHPVFMRVRTSDVSAFQQIFPFREYEFHVNRAPHAIIDAGANVGYASVYFANRYPDATIVAIEPDPENFELLKRNVAPYPNVRTVLGALWPEDGEVNLISTVGGSWGFMTQPVGEAPADPSGKVASLTRAYSVPTLMGMFGFEHVDIFKIDIEGAERELFADSAAWLPKVDALIIELHDNRKPGCEQSFQAATAGFGPSWRRGENVYVARPGGCIAA